MTLTDQEIGTIILTLSIALLLSILYYFNFTRRFRILVSFLAALEGFSSIMISSKYSALFGLSLFFISTNYLLRNNRITRVSNSHPQNISSKLKIITAYRPYFSIVGSIFILLIFIYSFNFSNRYLGHFELLLLLNFTFWILYNYIPTNFSWERDFTFLFLNMIILIVVLPGIIFLIIDGASFYNEDKLIEIFLTRPLFNIFSITGILSTYHGNTISFIASDGNIQKVLIAAQCSGIFSVQIFLSAFIAFVLMEFSLKETSTLFLLVIGVFLSYIANLLRMLIIVLVGYFYGMEALLVTHAYAGWLIFSLWMLIFWHFLMRNFTLESNSDESNIL